MGCACSVGAGPGPAPEDLSNLPAPTLEELRMHREIDNVDFYSDAVSADEPSALAASVAMKARLLVFRLSHGIDDDPNQFQEEINANEPVVVMDDYGFVNEWIDENDTVLDGDDPEPVPDVFAAATSADGKGSQQRAKEAVSRTSVKTQPATMQTAASVPTTCGAKPNHIRRRSSSSSSAAAEAPPPPGTSSPPRQRDSDHAPRGEPQPGAPSRSVAHPAAYAAPQSRRDGDAALPLPFHPPPPPPPPPEGDSGNAANGAGLSTSSLGNEVHDALGPTGPGGKYKLPLSPATETTEVEPQSDAMELDDSVRRSASPGAAAVLAVKPSQAADCETSPVPGAVGD